MTPHQIGRYQVLDILGVGGYATVLLADDPTRAAPVAVKVLADEHADDPGVRRRFVEEAYVLQRLVDPGLVTVHDVGDHDGRPFFVMEYCEGGTLTHRVASMSYTASIDEAVQLAGVMTGAIATVHRAGIVHRDIKPGNLMIRRTATGAPTTTSTPIGGLLGPDEELVLGDFGLAKVIDVQAAGRTLAGGTHGYGAPEQFLGGGPVDASADIYAASATVVALITGTSPRPAISERHLAFDRSVIAATGVLQVELTRGLAVDRSRRHRSIDEWHQALIQAANDGSRASSATVVEPRVPAPGSGVGGELGIDHLADVRIIGRGGFSTVYAARHTLLHQLVAVKVLARQLDEADRRHFERECQVMGRMSGHPNVVTVHHAGYSHHDTPYVTMELIEEGTLADLLAARTRLPWHEAVELVAPIADALGHAHRQGILHRDVKPENILVQGGVPKLTDFGIAVVREGGGATSSEVTASWLHTAPETFDNHRDERSDLYSLASTLYQLVAGRAPFWRADDDSLSPLMKRLISEPAPPFDPDLMPVGVNDFFASALAKDLDRRPQTTEEFTAALRTVGTTEATTGRILAASAVAVGAGSGGSPAADLTAPTVHLSTVGSGPPLGFRRLPSPELRSPWRRVLVTVATTVAVVALGFTSVAAWAAATGRGTAIGSAFDGSPPDDGSTGVTVASGDDLRGGSSPMSVATDVSDATDATGLSGAGGPDVDGDGVANSADRCPGTAPGASVDADGCSAAQRAALAGPTTTRRTTTVEATTTSTEEAPDLATVTTRPSTTPSTSASTVSVSAVSAVSAVSVSVSAVASSAVASSAGRSATSAEPAPSTTLPPATTEPATTEPATTEPATTTLTTRSTVSVSSLTVPPVTPTGGSVVLPGE